jgi:catechol 2,3-dioxygenase-like lactoylglutathione lyase family enzyme
MIIGLHAVQISVADVDSAAADYQRILGKPPSSYHVDGDLASVDFALDNINLRLVTSREPLGIERLDFSVADISYWRSRLGRLGISIDETQSGDTLLVIEKPSARGLGLALTHVDSGTHDTSSDDASNVRGLDHAVISSGNGDLTAALLGAKLQLDMRLDLTSPEWDARLLFFRCGDLIVEVFQSLSNAIAGTSDAFFGLTWRTADIDSTHKRLTELGVDVSPVRQGRKRGTKVFTIRNSTQGVPTLVLGATNNAALNAR